MNKLISTSLKSIVTKRCVPASCCTAFGLAALSNGLEKKRKIKGSNRINTAGKDDFIVVHITVGSTVSKTGNPFFCFSAKTAALCAPFSSLRLLPGVLILTASGRSCFTVGDKLTVALFFLLPDG